MCIVAVVGLCYPIYPYGNSVRWVTQHVLWAYHTCTVDQPTAQSVCQLCPVCLRICFFCFVFYFIYLVHVNNCIFIWTQTVNLQNRLSKICLVLPNTIYNCFIYFQKHFINSFLQIKLFSWKFYTLQSQPSWKGLERKKAIKAILSHLLFMDDITVGARMQHNWFSSCG